MPSDTSPPVPSRGASLPVMGALMLGLVSSAACADDGLVGDFADHDEAADFRSDSVFVPGIPDQFNQNNILSDTLFTDTSITGDMVQAFLESTPYQGNPRSWLADETVHGIRASDAIVNAAKAKGINPLMLLARLQVERSAVSKTQRPSRHKIDFAMGCGCFDNQPCLESFRGFDKQMDCAADTLRTHFDGSVAGDGLWVLGKSDRTLDPRTITPQNHATASLYAYTPWVLVGTGGAWLVWNVTRKYAASIFAAHPEAIPPRGEWYGDDCSLDGVCEIAGGECMDWFDSNAGETFGICSSSCNGVCPDDSGQQPTFCADVGGEGQCVVIATTFNENCAAMPGTHAALMQRFVGTSGAEAAYQTVCVPSHERLECDPQKFAGQCIDTNVTSCNTSLESGACPGPGNIRCCVD